MQQEYQNQQVKGLVYISDFITPQQQTQLIESIKLSPWNTSLKRRTQHYGYEYSYDRKSKATKTNEIPEWCLQVKKSIEKAIQTMNLKSQTDLKNVNFDQIIVNEYEPGQGINPHIDNINLFRDCVASLSLGSNAAMVFEKGQVKKEVILERRSVIVLVNDARYLWKHSIPSRKKDKGEARSVRYSLTFRQMKNTEQ